MCISARFGVGIKTAILWVRRARETGKTTARKQGHPKGSKLDEHEAFLLGLVAEKADVTLAEMQAQLRRRQAVLRRGNRQCIRAFGKVSPETQAGVPNEASQGDRTPGSIPARAGPRWRKDRKDARHSGRSPQPDRPCS